MKDMKYNQILLKVNTSEHIGHKSVVKHFLATAIEPLGKDVELWNFSGNVKFEFKKRDSDVFECHSVDLYFFECRK